jgi:cell pole-organizing protein PopZ
MKEDLSIEQILKSIRQVILGKRIYPVVGSDETASDKDNAQFDDKEEEIYELTKVVCKTPPEETQDKNLMNQKHTQPQKDIANEQAKKDSYIKESNEAIKSLTEIKKRLNKNSSTNKHSKTIEELVEEMMKPYIIDWLDDHLPKIVENLVDKEIKKLISNEKNSYNNR